LPLFYRGAYSYKIS